MAGRSSAVARRSGAIQRCSAARSDRTVDRFRTRAPGSARLGAAVASTDSYTAFSRRAQPQPRSPCRTGPGPRRPAAAGGPNRWPARPARRRSARRTADQNPGAGRDDLRDAADAGGDDRHAGGHGAQQRGRRCAVLAGVQHDIGGGQQPGRVVVAGHEAHPRVQLVAGRHPGFQPGPQRPSPASAIDQRRAVGQQLDRVQQQLVALAARIGAVLTASTSSGPRSSAARRRRRARGRPAPGR